MCHDDDLLERARRPVRQDSEVASSGGIAVMASCFVIILLFQTGWQTEGVFVAYKDMLAGLKICLINYLLE